MMISVLEHTFYKKDKEGHTEVLNQAIDLPQAANNFQALFLHSILCELTISTILN